MKLHFLKLNPDKTVVKLFKHKKSLITEFKLVDQISPDTVKVLGVSFDDGLKFKSFIKNKVQQCNFHLRNLYNMRASLDTQTRILLVTNLILTTVDYCNIVLLGSTDSALRPLRLIINKSLRFIYNVNYSDHITPYYTKSHFLPIRKRINYKASLVAFKIFNSQAPQVLIDDFLKFTPTSTMNLRDGSGRDKFMFSIDGSNLNSSRLTTLIKKQWNSLPIAIRKITTISTFKSKLKAFLFSL